MSEVEEEQKNEGTIPKLSKNMREMLWGPDDKRPRQKNSNPTRKVTFGAIAGACTVIFIWMIGDLVVQLNWHETGITVSSEVASAITTVITFFIAYWADPSVDDGIVSNVVSEKGNG